MKLIKSNNNSTLWVDLTYCVKSLLTLSMMGVVPGLAAVVSGVFVVTLTIII